MIKVTSSKFKRAAWFKQEGCFMPIISLPMITSAGISYNYPLSNKNAVDANYSDDNDCLSFEMDFDITQATQFNPNRIGSGGMIGSIIHLY